MKYKSKAKSKSKEYKLLLKMGYTEEEIELIKLSVKRKEYIPSNSSKDADKKSK